MSPPLIELQVEDPERLIWRRGGLRGEFGWWIAGRPVGAGARLEADLGGSLPWCAVTVEAFADDRLGRLGLRFDDGRLLPAEEAFRFRWPVPRAAVRR